MKTKTPLIIALILSLNILLPIGLIESTIPQSSYIVQNEPEEVLPEQSVPKEVVHRELIVEEPVIEEVPEEDIIYVYMTRTGKRYHRDGCRSLYNSRIEVELYKAKKYGLTPCLVCSPPE